MKKLENKNEKHQTFDVNVSVIVPIYNAKATILECLKAVSYTHLTLPTT